MRLAALSVVILVMAAGSVLAQGMPPSQQQPPTKAAPAIPPAPIGHRQPTQKDLSPGMAREEESDKGSPARDFGPLRSICRGC